jgi:hypothetical protein
MLIVYFLHNESVKYVKVIFQTDYFVVIVNEKTK